MKYRCLMIDHDDTAVDSTPAVHHPAHIEQMRRLGREQQTADLEEWFRINFHPGLLSYLNNTLKLTEEENRLCYSIWREFTTKITPPFFPGFLDILRRFRENGGRIVVVSHSEPDIILSHYRKQEEVPGLMPDEVFGWTGDPLRNKPYTWPVEESIKRFGLSPDEILVVDDLLPGITMAREAGVDSVGVGWSHRLPEIKEIFSRDCTYYFEEIYELDQLIFTS